MGDSCRMEEFSFDDWEDKVTSIFKPIAKAIWYTVHSITKYTPGQLALEVEMLMRTQIVVDQEFIKAKRLRSAQSVIKRKN